MDMAKTNDPPQRKWVHRMLSVDPETMTGVCAHCGPVRVTRKRNNRKRTMRYACYEAEIRFKQHGAERRRVPKYRRFKKPECERCGFVPVDMCQLDVHHRDSDRRNNDPANLETVCANCHRLEIINRQRYAARAA